jgi:hypothetical protein
MTNIWILLIVFIWFMFSLLYFSKEVSNFLNGRGKKSSASALNNAGTDLAIFGGSRTDTQGQRI